MKKLIYKFQWSIRKWMLPKWGIKVHQTENLLGVTLNGKFIQYGWSYHWRYFTGRIL